MPSKNVAYVEGEAISEELIFTLADEITSAAWNENDGTAAVSRWTETYRQSNTKWVTYKQMTRANVTGVYTHTNGVSYTVNHVSTLLQSLDARPDATGKLSETGSTGRWIKVFGPITYTDKTGVSVTEESSGFLLVKVPVGVKILKQRRKNLDNSVTDDAGWNEFEINGDLPAETMGNWDYFISFGSMVIDDDPWSGGLPAAYAVPIYKFTERYYTANPVHSYDDTVVLKSIPDNSDGSVSPDHYYVMFKHPKEQWNYFDIYYGKGFVGTNVVGSPQETYIRACGLTAVVPGQTPPVTNQKEAEAAYLRQTANAFAAASEVWDKDIDGVTELKSPASHYHYGADSVLTWLPNKKRRPDYYVRYNVSVSNNRVAIVLEGDPAPDMDGYYRSFAYIGRIKPFNAFDNGSNYAMTVGMGDLDVKKTGMDKDDVAQDKNPSYAGWGPYTSNGMYSVSMFATRGNVFFQAHYPAFITELPNYPSVGTIPPELSKLIVEKNGYQASSWTGFYHGSPIYLAHQFEGYRGFMDSVIAINDHNLVNEDELIVDTEEAKPGGGTWTEVYKFFSLKSPVSFLDISPNPNGMTIAILKEVK